MCCTRLAGNTGHKKSPFWHHRTTLSGYIFGSKACIDHRKINFLNSNTPFICRDNMVNFDLLTAEICWRVWGTPANFNGFLVLAALLHGTLVVGVAFLRPHVVLSLRQSPKVKSSCSCVVVLLVCVVLDHYDRSSSVISKQVIRATSV